MSDEFTLDLEPEPEPKPQPTPQRREPPPALKRTSTRKRVERPKRTPRSTAPAGGGGGKLARWLRWIVSPRFYYGLGFLLTGYAVYALYNPGWGAMARMWPHEALGIDGTFAWNLATAQLVALIVLALVLLVATFLPAPHPARVITRRSMTGSCPSSTRAASSTARASPSPAGRPSSSPPAMPAPRSFANRPSVSRRRRIWTRGATNSNAGYAPCSASSC